MNYSEEPKMSTTNEGIPRVVEDGPDARTRPSTQKKKRRLSETKREIKCFSKPYPRLLADDAPGRFARLWSKEKLCFSPAYCSTIIMGFRHALLVFLIVLFSFFAFATKVLWIQWITVAVFFGFFLLFDLLFLNDAAFVFDPDPDNWRRRVSSD